MIDLLVRLNECAVAWATPQGGRARLSSARRIVVGDFGPRRAEDRRALPACGDQNSVCSTSHRLLSNSSAPDKDPNQTNRLIPAHKPKNFTTEARRHGEENPNSVLQQGKLPLCLCGESLGWIARPLMSAQRQLAEAFRFAYG